MKIDASMSSDSLSDIARLSESAEGEAFFDAMWLSETSHDPFLQLALAAEHTTKIRIGTAIALAFTRSPTVLAQTAWDLQRFSKGRMLLGLGSQVRGHIERRFSEEWLPPVARMREVISLLRTIWTSWQSGKRLDFRGRFYAVNLMSGFFSPGPIDHPDIQIYLAAVNRKMSSLAGELCQGIHVHPLHTVRYLKEVTLPAIQAGLQTSGRQRSDIEVAIPVFAATGETEEEIRNNKERLRQQVAFYASTKAYSAVMELHGWGETASRLYDKSVRGDWSAMPSEISDAMMEEFVVEGVWDELPGILKERYLGVADRVRLYAPYDASSHWRHFSGAFR
jgi:probable F420-dependent oxidoreductase